MPRLYQPNLTGGILAEGMYARSDTEKYRTGVRDALNFMIRPRGGMANRPGLRVAGGFDVPDAWCIPFSFSTEDTYILEFFHGGFRVLHNGAYVLDSDVSPQSVVSVTEEGSAKLVMVNSGAAGEFSSGDLVYLQDPSGTHVFDQMILRVSVVSGSQLTVHAVRQTNTVDTSAGAAMWGEIGSGATLEKVYAATAPYNADQLPALRYAQDGDVMYVAHPAYALRALTRLAVDDWDLTPEDFTPETATPTGVAVDEDPASGSKTYRYRVSAISDDALEESEASGSVVASNDLTIAGNINTVTWDAVAGAALYKVYKKNGSVYGYIGATTTLEFEDQNIDPDVEDNPVVVRSPFPSSGNYPAVVSFVEQRLALASTDNDPQVVELSRSDSFNNFGRSFPLQPDDAIRFRIRARQINDVRALVSAEELILFTSAGEWVVTGSELESILTPTSLVAKQLTFFGSANIEPLPVGSSVLFVVHSGNQIRDWALSRDPKSRDLTILCTDLFAGRLVVSWTYTQTPDSLIWVVLDDGTLLSLAYLEEHEVWGWTRHELGGDAVVRQVVSVREGTRDVLYVVVVRNFGESTITVTERMAAREDTVVEDCYYVDSGLSYDGEPTTVVTGLMHLAGQEVVALTDGSVLGGLIVDEAGKVTLPVEASKIHVGLSYACVIQTLDVDFEVEQLGSMQGRFKALTEVAVMVEKSRGLAVGRDLLNTESLDEWSPDMGDGPIPLVTQTLLYTVDGDWLRNASTTIVQQYPLPATVNGIAPDWAIGE